MLISDKYKYIFIAIPKTGTTTIQTFLRKNDDSCIWNGINVGGEEIMVDEHIKAKDLKKIMGEQFSKYTIIAFIRNPYARRVSEYFFYKNGYIKKSRYAIRNFIAWSNVILTKILPFGIWSVIKPQKKLVDYFFDGSNNLLIDLAGKTENLGEDLLAICREVGIPLKDENILVKNRSKHSSTEKYYSNKLFTKLYSQKVKGDIELYENYKHTLHIENHKSKVL